MRTNMSIRLRILINFVNTNWTCLEEQKHSLDTCAVEDSCNLRRSRWRINCGLNLLVCRVEENDGVIVESHEKGSRSVEVLVSVALIAFAHTADVLFGYVITGCKMADQTDLDETFEYHGVDLIINELNILNRISLWKVLNRRVDSNIETIELNHLLEAPDSNFAVLGGWHEVGGFGLDWCQGCDSSGVALEDVNRFERFLCVHDFHAFVGTIFSVQIGLVLF